MSARKSKSDVSATESAGPKRLTKRLSHPQPTGNRPTVLRWTPGADTGGHKFKLTDVRIAEATGGTGEIDSVCIGNEVVPRWGGDAICERFEMISVEIRNIGDPSHYVIELEGEVLSADE